MRLLRISKDIVATIMIELIILFPISMVSNITPVYASINDNSQDNQDNNDIAINVSIPEYYNNRQIDIAGVTEEGVLVSIYINNNFRGEMITGADGGFRFNSMDMNEGINKIKITARKDNSFSEKNYDVNVDTTNPVLEISEIPEIVGKQRVRISGNVSEFVRIRFYVTEDKEDTLPPPKVEGFINTSVGANIVELSWDMINVSDFARYIIYRNGTPIVTIDDERYTDYSDVTVDSNAVYKYEIAAMDVFGNIGEKSDALIIRTKPGGVIRNLNEGVDIYDGIGGLQKSIETSDKFDEELVLGRKDGFYKIKVEAKDRAGNTFVYSKSVLLDQSNPKIEIISPRRGAEIYESYADSVTIEGRTEPGARVYLFLGRTPFGMINMSFSVSGLPDRIEDLDEADLRADCDFRVLGKERCGTHADYDTIANADGYFRFENVDLTSILGGALRVNRISTGEIHDFINLEALRESMDARLLFIAMDAAGRKGVKNVLYRIRNCWTGNFSWVIKPLPEYQSPSFLSVERLREGTETIYFYLNFSYIGRGKEGRVTRVYITNACGREYLENQPGFNYSCDILQRSCTERLSPSGKTAYVACRLGRLEGVEKWSDDDWDSFLDAVHDELLFPFKVRIDYEEKIGRQTKRGTQTSCLTIGYVVDATRINPKEVLPDWLLYDFVDWLNDSIKILDDWIDKTSEILEWTAIGCIVSFFTKFVVQVYRKITCYYDRYYKTIRDVVKRVGGEEKQEQEDECIECLRMYDPDVVKDFVEKKIDVQDKISDTCLEKCYPTCASAWKAEESMYKAYRWACDRVFGHKTPSRWTESISDEQLFQKLSQGTGCANDQSVRGRPVRAVRCRDIEAKYRISGTFGPSDKCLEVMTGKNEETLYHIDGPASVGESVYRISALKSTVGPSLIYEYAIKQNEDNYLLPMQETCEEICSGKFMKEKKPEIGLVAKKGSKKVRIGLEDSKEISKDEYLVYGCLTPNECISYASGDQRRISIGGENKEVEVKNAVPMGYTSDCFMPEYASSNPDKRIECCCINSKVGANPQYYQPGDVENKDGSFSASGYENMRWSYRYSKIKYKNKEYNENRYIDGRDIMACFGQNNWIYDGFFVPKGKTGNLLIIDPIRDHIATFQCLSIGGILNRLILIKNIMGALKTCLIQVRTTGEADAGVCKELFTQYICSFIWKIITWLRDGCLPFGSGIDFTKSENSVLEFLSVGMKGVWDSVGEMQEELASEYGNAKLNNLLGAGEEAIFRKVCLASFGYDWEIDVNNLVDVAYSTPYATLVQAILPSREFLTFDPTTGKATYEYRASWLINPGCDLDSYQVYLTCVTRDDMRKYPGINCQKQKDPWGRNCDCLDIPEDKKETDMEVFFYQSRSKIKQNSLVEVDSSMIPDRIKTSRFRYDHLKFVLNVDSRFARSGGLVENCFPEGHEDGVFYFPITDYTAREIAGCSIMADGTFSCSGGMNLFYEEGSAYFEEIEIEPSYSITQYDFGDVEGVTLYESEPIVSTIKYFKDEKKQCLVARLLNRNGDIIRSTARELREKQHGSHEEIINLGYTIKREDVLGQQGSIFVSYTDNNDEERNGGLIYEVDDMVDMKSGEDFIEFIDGDGDGRIQISRESKDICRYNGKDIQIKDHYENGGFSIELKGLNIKMKIRRVTADTNNFKFTIRGDKLEGVSGNKEPMFYLHFDLRHPKRNGDCSEVAGPQYDESQIIVANGIRQSVDIPIFLLPGKRKVIDCSTRFEQEEITDENGNEVEKYCACNSRKNNCPSGEFRYCYGKCRKYPRCDVNVRLEEDCVCNPTTPANKADCGIGEICVENNGRYMCQEESTSEGGVV